MISLLMKQLDVDVSPPAFLWDPHLNLTDVTFDLDLCDLSMFITIPHLVTITQTVLEI